MSKKKKKYFAQTNCDNPHKAKYFFDLNEAILFINNNGGGTVKKRNSKIVKSIGNIKLDIPIACWGIVYDSFNPLSNDLDESILPIEDPESV